jgi:hypothetical protein
VVTAVEVVVDENFPVAVQKITSLEPVQAFEVQGFKTLEEAARENHQGKTAAFGFAKTQNSHWAT